MKLRFFGPGGRAWWLLLRMKHIFRAQAVLLMPNRFKDTYMFSLGSVTQADIDEVNRADNELRSQGMARP